MNKRAMKFYVFLLILTFLFTFKDKNHVIARSLNYQESGGVDLFVLLDQSKIMETTDPDNLRIDAAKYLVDYLSFYASANREQKHRVSVIGFGGQENSRAMVPLVDVPITHQLEQDPLLINIKDKIVPEILGRSGEQNIASGIDLVEKQLNQAENLGSDRQIVIIIITQGVPYDKKVDKTILDENFDEIHNKYNDLTKKYPAKWDLFVLGIQEEFNFWSDYDLEGDDKWGGIATEAELIPDINEMKTKIVRELSPLLGMSNKIFASKEIIEVGPFLDFIQFSIFKYQDEGEIIVSYTDTDGRNVVIGSNQDNVTVQSGESYDLWRIKNPTPGKWRVDSGKDAKIDVFRQEKLNQVEAVFPVDNIPQNIPLFVRVKIPGFIPAEQKYPITWDAEVIDPAGEITSLNFKPSDEIGVFINTRQYNPEEIGIYQVRVNANVISDVDGESIGLPELQYEFSVSPISLQFDPLPPYLQYYPVESITFELIGNENQLVKIDPEIELDASIKVTDPSQVSSVQSLKELEPGRFQTQSPLFFGGNGNHNIELIVKASNENVYTESISIDTIRKLELVSPGDMVPFKAALSNLGIRILDEMGKPYSPLNMEYPLQLEATVIPVADENPSTRTLKYDSETKTYQAEFDQLPTNQLGKPIVQIKGFVQFDGQKKIAFEQNLSYEVTHDLPYFQVLEPIEDDNYPLRKWFREVPVPIQIQWRQNQKPIDPREVFINDPKTLVSVDIVGPDQVLISDLQLEQISENAPSIWGLYLSELTLPGEYTVKYDFNPAMLAATKELYYDFDPVDVKFTRSETSFWQFLQIALLGILILLGIAFLIWFIVFINEFLPPYPTGKLILGRKNFRDFGSKPQEWELNLQIQKPKRKTITWRPIPENLEQLGFSQLVIRKLSKESEFGVSVELQELDGQEGMIIPVESMNEHGIGQSLQQGYRYYLKYMTSAQKNAN
jgi:hypothetical protein